GGSLSLRRTQGKIVHLKQWSAGGDLRTFGSVDAGDRSRREGTDEDAVLRLKDDAAFDVFVPEGKAGEYEEAGDEIHRVAEERPGANAVALIEVDEFHKVHQ